MTEQTKDDQGFFYVIQESAKILYVDDDPILREFAMVNLASEQATIVTAADGVDALAGLTEFGPDLMVLDLEMPRMDGFEVLERLRRNETWSRLPVIVATGREDVVAIDRAFECGATSFVVKPVNWRLLSYQIRYVLRSSRSEAVCLRAQARAARDAERAAAQLRELATDCSHFLVAALGIDPSLSSAALPLAVATERLLRAPKVQ